MSIGFKDLVNLKVGQRVYISAIRKGVNPGAKLYLNLTPRPAEIISIEYHYGTPFHVIVKYIDNKNKQKEQIIGFLMPYDKMLFYTFESAKEWYIKQINQIKNDYEKDMESIQKNIANFQKIIDKVKSINEQDIHNI